MTSAGRLSRAERVDGEDLDPVGVEELLLDRVDDLEGPDRRAGRMDRARRTQLPAALEDAGRGSPGNRPYHRHQEHTSRSREG